MKKFISGVLVAIVGLSGLIGCSSSSNENSVDGIKAKKVRIATQKALGAADILIAKEKGFLEEELKEYGVKIEWTNFESGPPMNESFAAGGQDIGYIGDVPLIIAKASGQKTVTIANAGYNPNTSALVVAKDSNIKDVSELKGKKVAFVKGSFGHHLLGKLLSNAGLSFKDIEEVNLPIADIANTVQSKQADAGIIWDPNLIKAVKNNQVKVLADGSNGVKRNAAYYFATEEFAKDNPKIIVAYIKAIEKSNKFISEHPDEAAELLVGVTNISKEDILEVFANYNYSPSINDDDISELKEVNDFLKENDLIQSKIDIDSFVDLKYLKEAGIE